MTSIVCYFFTKRRLDDTKLVIGRRKGPHSDGVSASYFILN